MRPPDQPLGYGLAAPRNGARSLLSALQAHVIKWLLFDSRPQTKDNKCDVPPDTYLRPSEERQEEALWRACSEVIWRCGGGNSIQAGVDPKAVVALPTDHCYVQHSSQYYQDGVTEKAMPQFGILSRSPVGLLVWYGGEENSKNNINKQLLVALDIMEFSSTPIVNC
ncbi:hypothetical protein HF086_011371 [Spodoptera exigua]|uniref:Ubiquitin carboxyl-terminal hydrolase MINDY n=1 Tax=Spodoptera exigua TaxID=7107 RepID=A0A922MKS7_SPOEX|nr:hypothetical protein HF086_011371 [Spodoptera exigua]